MKGAVRGGGLWNLHRGAMRVSLLDEEEEEEEVVSNGEGSAVLRTGFPCRFCWMRVCRLP